MKVTEEKVAVYVHHTTSICLPGVLKKDGVKKFGRRLVKIK
jgi:hypothetical protein